MNALIKLQEGNSFELLAATAFRNDGYTIISQKFRYTKVGEIDFIAVKNNEIIFVEARFRRSRYLGVSSFSINKAKIRRIILTAFYFISLNKEYKKYRKSFLFITNDLDNQGKLKIYNLFN